MKWLDVLGWTATVVFSSSYFFKRPAVLRKIQAAAATLWIIYGFAIGAAPVVVANLIVGIAAIYTAMQGNRDSNAEDVQAQHASEGPGIDSPMQARS